MQEADQEKMGTQELMGCLEEKVQMDLLEIEECLEFKECQGSRVTEDGMDLLERKDSWVHQVQKEEKAKLVDMDHKVE